MGMGTVPCRGFIMPWDEIVKICPVQTKLLESALESAEMSLDEFGQEAQFSDLEDSFVKEAWQALCDNFERNTKVGKSCLTLSVGYYDEESGDRYDDLEGGVYFEVSGAEIISPAGEKFKDKYKLSAWTVYG